MFTQIKYVNSEGYIVALDSNGVWQSLSSGQEYDYIVGGRYGDIAPYVPPLDPTPEELRAQMPNLSAVEFREALRSVVLPDYPDGISKAQIQAAINRIPNEKDRDRAQDYWDRATYYQRSNLIVDQLAGLLVPPVTPEQIDQYWPKVIFA